MRLNKLNLTRYGMFSGEMLDFGARSSDQPDFHIVYGLNESGKTTSLEAWLDFLFGIKRGSQYGFKHSKAMEIQAVLEKDNTLVEYKRIRKTKDSLFDIDDEIVPDAVLNALLGGYSRPDYEILFTANDQTLEKGGNEILASKGELGKLLFSASAGMADLSERLQELQLQNEQFYKKRTSKNQLVQIKQELAELKGIWQEKDKGVNEYKALVRKFEEATGNLENTRNDLSHFKMELSQVERKIDALRWVASLSDTQNELKDYEELPVPPQNWRTLLDSWGQEMIETKGRLDQLSVEIERMESKVSGNKIDETALGLEDKVFKARAQKESYSTVVRDLPKRNSRQAELSTEIEYLTRRLGYDYREESNIIPDSATIGLIRDLMQENSGLEVNYQSTQEELRTATKEMDSLQAKVDQEGELDHEIGAVESILREIRENDPRPLLRTISTDVLEAEGDIDKCMYNLLPWEGSYKELVDLQCPSKQTIVLHQKRYEEANRTYLEGCRKKENLGNEIRELENVIAKIETEAVTIEDLAGSRNQRENKWAVHKTTLDISTAEQFEIAMRSDDQITSRAAEQKANKALRSDRQAKLKELRYQLEKEEQNCQVLEKELEVKNEARKGVLKGIPGLDNIQNADEFIRWLDLRENTIDKVRKLRGLQTRNDHFEGVEKSYKKSLALALKEARIACKEHWTLEMLISAAENLIEKLKEIKSIRNQHLRARVTHQARLEAFNEAKGKKLDWEKKWAKVCKRTLFGQTTIPQVSEMKEIISTLDDLIPKVTELNILKDRIEKMKEDAARFTRNVEELAQELGIEGNDILHLWNSVETHVQNTLQKHNENQNIIADLESRREEKLGLEGDISRINKAIEEFGVIYGEKSLAEIKNCCGKAEKYQELKSDEEKALENIRETMGLPTKQEAIDQVAGLEVSTLEGKKSRLESKIKECEGELEDRLASQREARRELDTVSGDDSIAIIKESYENLLIELKEKVLVHLKDKFGIIALDQAIRKFRDTHKSEMMTLASEIFAKISCGKYKSLGTTLEKGKEILTVEPEGGGTKFVDGLSKGTRFQLYLSLRIAGFYEIIKSNQQAPFLADDILETFDNKRTAEALQVLEQMGNSCQVIYFTHHQHILDIAERVCPKARIHTLASSS